MEEQRGESSIGSGVADGGGRSARKRWNAISGAVTAEAHTAAATDASLLLASLEQAPVEDEAEAALIEVLERRQVTFDANLPLSTLSLIDA